MCIRQNPQKTGSGIAGFHENTYSYVFCVDRVFLQAYDKTIKEVRYGKTTLFKRDPGTHYIFGN